MAPTWSLIFPSSLGAELEALKGNISKTKIRFSKLLDYSEELVFSSLTNRYGKYLQEKWFAATPIKTRNDEESGWSSTLSTGLRRTPPQKTVCGNNQLKQELIEEMRWTKKTKRSAMAAQTSINQGQRPSQPSTLVVLAHPHHGA